MSIELNINQPPYWYKTTKFVCSGMSAACAMVGIGHPFDTMKVRLQSQSQMNKVYSGFSDVVIKTMRWEGIPGFYKGFRIPLAGQLITRTVLFTSFDLAKDICLNNKGPQNRIQLSIPESLLCGFISGICTGTVDTPIELCKSKLQTQIISLKNNNLKDTYFKGVTHFYLDTLRNYGIRGIYHGYIAHLLRQTVGCTFYFSTYEYIKFKMLNNINNQVNDHSAASLMYVSIISGALSGISYWIACYNFDVIKSAMMFEPIDKNKRTHKSYYQLIKHLYQHEGGYARFWKGFTPCILRSAPTNSAIFFAVEFSKRYFPSYETFNTLI